MKILLMYYFFSFDNEILCEFLPIDFQNNSTDKLKLILNFIETKKYGNKFLHPDKATYSYKFDKILTEVLSCSNIFKLFYSLNLNKTNFDDMGKIVNFIFSLATKFVNKDNEIIVQLSYNVMEMDNKERTNQLGYLTVNLINNCYQEKVKKISDDESVFSLLFNVFSFIPLDYNNYNFEYLNNIFEKMSQQILNEAIIFTSNHEINKDYSKNKHNTLSKEEVLQMFYEDKIEILYKYIGIIFNSISDNYNNNYKSAFEFLNLIEKYYFYKLEFNSKTHEDNLSLKDDIKNIFQSNSNPYKPFNDSNVKIVSKFNSNEKYNYYENKKFKNLIKKFIYNISTIEFINNNDKFFNEIFVDNFKYFNVIPHLNIFDKLFLYKNKERDIEIFLNFLLDNCNTLNDLENKNIDKQQIKTINRY